MNKHIIARIGAKQNTFQQNQPLSYPTIMETKVPRSLSTKTTRLTYPTISPNKINFYHILILISLMTLSLSECVYKITSHLPAVNCVSGKMCHILHKRTCLISCILGTNTLYFSYIFIFLPPNVTTA